MKERGLALAAVAAVAILVDCGGGGGGGGAVAPATVPSGTAGAPAGYAKATFSITVPKGATTSAATRKPQLVTANTQSITFTLVATTATGVATGTASAAFPLTATSPGCTTVAAGVSCTLSLSAPVGTDAYVANVYSSVNAAAGTQTGSGAVQLTVQANAANAASLSLNGPIASITLASNCPLVNSLEAGLGCIVGSYSDFVNGEGIGLLNPAFFGTPSPSQNFLSPLRVYAIASDVNGNEIVAPTVYDQPIALALQNAYGNLSLTLGVTYASASLAETNGATTASVSSPGGGAISGLVEVWSPLDAISVTLTPNLTGFFEGYLVSGIGTSVAPIPTYTSSPNPNLTPGPFLLIGGASLGSASASPTPSPTPTAAPLGPLSWTNLSSYTGSGGSPVFLTTAPGPSNPTAYSIEFPLPPSPPPFNVTVGLASNYAFAGSYSITNGCSGTVVSGLPATVPAIGTAGANATVQFSLVATSTATCSISASDGTNTSTLVIFVDQNGLLLQGHQRAKPR